MVVRLESGIGSEAGRHHFVCQRRCRAGAHTRSQDDGNSCSRGVGGEYAGTAARWTRSSREARLISREGEMASASKESGSSWSVRALLAGAVGAMIVSAPIAARAADSELPDAIKAVTGDTGPQTQWTGPTTGPKAPP